MHLQRKSLIKYLLNKHSNYVTLSGTLFWFMYQYIEFFIMVRGLKIWKWPRCLRTSDRQWPLLNIPRLRDGIVTVLVRIAKSWQITFMKQEHHPVHSCEAGMKRLTCQNQSVVLPTSCSNHTVIFESLN